jgi:hypothetical protein
MAPPKSFSAPASSARAHAGGQRSARDGRSEAWAKQLRTELAADELLALLLALRQVRLQLREVRAQLQAGAIHKASGTCK